MSICDTNELNQSGNVISKNRTEMEMFFLNIEQEWKCHY